MNKILALFMVAVTAAQAYVLPGAMSRGYGYPYNDPLSFAGGVAGGVANSLSGYGSSLGGYGGLGGPLGGYGGPVTRNLAQGGGLMRPGGYGGGLVPRPGLSMDYGFLDG